MRQKIKNFIMVAMFGLTMGVPAFAPAIASADIPSQVCQGANSAASTPGSDCTTNGGEDAIKKVAAKLVNIFSIIVGIAAVIMIIFGGFKYITSGGDSNNVSGAKNTLIYAIVGLIVVALAQFIVHYVLTTASTSLQ